MPSICLQIGRSHKSPSVLLPLPPPFISIAKTPRRRTYSRALYVHNAYIHTDAAQSHLPGYRTAACKEEEGEKKTVHSSYLFAAQCVCMDGRWFFLLYPPPS